MLDVDHEEPLWSLLDGLEYVAHSTWKHHASDEHEDCQGRGDCPHWRIVCHSRGRWRPPTGTRSGAALGSGSARTPTRAPRTPRVSSGSRPLDQAAPRDSKRQHGRWLDPAELRPVPERSRSDACCLDPRRGVGARRVTADGERPGDRFEREADWCRDILPDWKPVGVHGDNLMLRRPGSTNPYGATISKRGEGVLYVFSSNAAPLQPNTCYSKFGAYATLHHGGDFTRAAAHLAERYRRKERPPPDSAMQSMSVVHCRRSALTTMPEGRHPRRRYARAGGRRARSSSRSRRRAFAIAISRASSRSAGHAVAAGQRITLSRGKTALDVTTLNLEKNSQRRTFCAKAPVEERRRAEVAGAAPAPRRAASRG